MTELKWVYSFNGEYYKEIFDTEEEAIQSAFDEIKTNDDYRGDASFWLANPKMHNPQICIESIIEELEDQAYDFADEHSEGWLYNTPDTEIKQLESDLNKVLIAWLIKNKNMPNFYRVMNAKEYAFDSEWIKKWMLIPE